MSNIVGQPTASDSPKTTFFAGDIQKLSTDKVDVTLYNGTPFSLSSVRSEYPGDLYIAEVKYRTDDYIAGLELSYEIEGYSVVDISYTWEGRGCELGVKNYITQISKSNKKIISYFNPDISSFNIIEGTDYISRNPSNDETAFFVILEKTSEENYFKISEKFKSVKNIDNSGSSILESVPTLSKWSLETAFGAEALKNPSYIKRSAQMAVTNLYDESIDIDSSLNTIDVLDIVGICNHRWYSLNPGGNAGAINNKVYVPAYVEIENSNVSKTDLVDAELKIKNIDITNNGNTFNLIIDIGFNASVTSHGWQFDIGRNWESYSFVDQENNSLIKPNVIFKGQLEELKEYYDYRVVSIDNRFGYDNISRVSIYRKPFNGNDPSALVDISRQGILLNSHGTQPRKYSETIIRLEWNGVRKSSNINLMPRKEYYVKKAVENTSEEIKPGDRWYGPVNYDSETCVWYTGEYFNPRDSVELEAKWDLFDILNRKSITNSSLNFIKHYSRTEQDLINFSYQFVYPEEGPTADFGVLEQYGNDFQTYAESILGYVNSTISNGLSSGNQSKYDYEPIVPDGYLAGYMNDHDLSGTKNIVDTSALSNLFSIRISTNSDGDTQEAITANAVKNILDNRIVPGERNSNDVPGKRTHTSRAVEKKILNSLNKIVPTLIINENSTMTYPQIEPTIVQSNSDGSVLYFTEALDCAQGNFPKEFRSWKHYFSEIYDINHLDVPEDDFKFFQVKLASNSEKAKFLKGVTFAVDFFPNESKNSYSGGVQLGSNNIFRIGKISGAPSDVDDLNQNAYVNISLPGTKDFPNGAIVARFHKEAWTFNGYTYSRVNTTDAHQIAAQSAVNDTEFDKLYLELNYDYGANSVLPPLSRDGGPMILASFFVYGNHDTPVVYSIDREGQNFPGNQFPVQATWSDVPRVTTQDEYIENIENGLLYFGPKLNNKNFILKDNSTSVCTYDDVDLFIQVENRREITIKSLAGEAYRTGSFTITTNERKQVDIDTFTSNLDFDAPVKTDRGYQSWNIAFSSSTDINGLDEICRIKFSEDIFSPEIEDADPNVEIIYPPIGVDKTLNAPFNDENNIYPTWENCLIHSDLSDSNYVETVNNEVYALSNLVDYTNFKKNSIATSPLYTQGGFDGKFKSMYFENGDIFENFKTFSVNKDVNSSLSYEVVADIQTKNRRHRLPTTLNPHGETRNILSFRLYDSSGGNVDFGNYVFTSLQYEEDEYYTQSKLDAIKRLLSLNDQGTVNNVTGRFLEELFLSGSIYAFKDEVQSENQGGIIVTKNVRTLITQEDIDNGYQIDENTKYFLNNYGPWLYNGSTGAPDNQTYNYTSGSLQGITEEGFFTKEQLEAEDSPLKEGVYADDGNGGIARAEYPQWYMTVDKDGKFYIKTDNPDVEYLDEQSQASLLDCLIMYLYNDAASDWNTPDNTVEYLSEILSHFWNDREFDYLRLKNDDGEGVILQDKNGKLLASKDRKFFTLYSTRKNNNIGANSFERISYNQPLKIYLPSEYEIKNNEYFNDSNPELLYGPYHIRLEIGLNNKTLDLYINGKLYSSEVLSDESYAGTPFSNILDTCSTGDTLAIYSKIGYQRDNYYTRLDADTIVGNDGDQTLTGSINVKEYVYDHLNIYVGEFACFNRAWTDDERETSAANLVWKWGFEENLVSSNPFYEQRPSLINSKFTNEEVHPDKLAIDAIRDYSRNKNFKTDSCRYSSKIVERKLQITNATFDSLDMSTFNQRDLPPGFELTSDAESKIYVSKWDAENGLLYLSYKSGKKIDGFQVELGNFIDNPEEYILIKDATGVGIIDAYKSDIMDANKWSAPVVGKGPGTYPHGKVNKIIYATAPELYLDQSSPYPGRALGSWPLPATTRGTEIELCTIKVDPQAFKGAPVIESYTLVSNDGPLGIPDSGFNGSTSADLIISRSGSLQEVEELVKSGYYDAGSSINDIADLAENYDASGNHIVDIADLISIRNHIIINDGEVTNQNNNFVPFVYAPNSVDLPDYNITASLSTDISALKVTLSWTLNANAARTFEIWRRTFNVVNQSAPSGIWEQVGQTSENSWIDQEPPINRLADTIEDNPEFEYLLIATNEYGSSTFNTSTLQFPVYFSGNLQVNNISVTTQKGREITITPSYYDDNSAAPPFGQNTSEADNFNITFGPPDMAVGKFIEGTGTFRFDPNYANFVGRITGVYEVVNTRTGDWKEGQYVINVLPESFELNYTQTKIIDAYSNIIYFDLNDVGSVDYVALQRTTNPSSWAGSRVGEWIKTKDLENNIIRIEDIIRGEDYNDFSVSEIFYYRILAYEDLNDDSDLDQGTDLEILSDILTVTCDAREKLESHTFAAPNANSCAIPNPVVSFQIPQLTSSVGMYAKSYSVERVNGDVHSLEQVYHNTGSSPINVNVDVDRVSGCNELYFRSFRVVGLSEDLMTTEYNVITASLDKCPNTPVAKSVTVKACLNEEFQGDLKTYLSNASEDVSLASFAEVGSLIGLTLNSDGTFSYTPTSTSSVSFDYTGTSCGVTSNTATITFEVSDECVLCPDDQEEVICRYAKVNQEYPEFAGHTPLKYKDRNVSNIRLRELQEDSYKVSSNKS